MIKYLSIVKKLTLDFKIKATAEEIYLALTNPFTIELWSGFKAIMSEIPGTEFAIWEGEITGKNLQFEKNKKIKQQWYFEGEKSESIVEISIVEKKKSCLVKMFQTNIPDDAFENIKEGWKTMYFKSLKDFFELD